jgi:hypothetical protein
MKWKLSIFKNVIVAKKIFFARPKSANYAIKLLFVSSNLSAGVAALVLFAWLHREVNNNKTGDVTSL